MREGAGELIVIQFYIPQLPCVSKEVRWYSSMKLIATQKQILQLRRVRGMPEKGGRDTAVKAIPF